ncbi:subtilase [Colletotrichum orchidophilum]|uniref:Subtilase n=1 Tax=Colletotrichum orchidophilum TaxID=1209926 RepID=A0A1G4AQC2_9PEZI|nr:subtilase [Colletotrichum orchidophilum]OHE91370.1 subtilase [Colletotrichum orchidophilum]
MRLTTAAAILSFVGASLARFGHQEQTPGEIPSSRTRRFIVELAKDSDLKKLKSELSDFAGATVYKTFRSDVFTGVSVELTGDNEEDLRLLQGASNVWPSRRVQRAVVESGRAFSGDVSAGNYNIHGITGVQKLHEEGILGKGAKVAVVDAGVDYTHPALGGGFGEGFKVMGGYDLVGDSAWPTEGYDKRPDNDPYEEDALGGHGTHVTGIVVGKSDSWQGVAPEANILSYKVFAGSNGDTDEETLIEAFLMAHKDGADIITCSIGGRGGFSSNAWAEIASRLVDQGLVVTISAGNTGEGGAFLGDNGQSGRSVLSVASTEPPYVPGMPFEVTFDYGNGEVKKSTYGFFFGGLTHSFPLNSTGLPITALSYDPYNTTIGCRFLGPETRNLSGALVLAPRGGCDGPNKRYVLHAAGAEYVLLFNDKSLFPMPSSYDTLRVEGVTENAVGVEILSALAKGAKLTARFFNESNSNLINLKNPAVVSSFFTSMGGLYDLQIKPDVAAPGSNIFSTIPHGKYALKSGTSMATPYVAGIAALFISKYGGRNTHGPGFGRRLSARILSSCDSLPWNNGLNMTDYDARAPVFQIGNGLVNATKIMDYRTELSFAKFALNDTTHFRASQSVMITNNCTGPVTYRFCVEAAGTYEVLDDKAEPSIKMGPQYRGLVPLTTQMAPNVTFPGDFTVGPGETREAIFAFEPPKGGNQTAMPLYSGKILVYGSNGEQLSVPYMGVASDLQNGFRKMFVEKYPYVNSGRGETPIMYKTNFTFDLSLKAQDFPKLYMNFRWGASVLRWDIFGRGWEEKSWGTYPPVPGKDGFVGHAATWDNEKHASVFDPDNDNELDLVRGPLGELSRDDYNYAPWRAWWLGRFSDGSKIKPGNYTMRVAALTPFGDPTKSDHWDVWRHDFEVEANLTLSDG